MRTWLLELDNDHTLRNSGWRILVTPTALYWVILLWTNNFFLKLEGFEAPPFQVQELDNNQTNLYVLSKMVETSKDWSSFWCKSKLFYSLIFISKLKALSMWKCAIENTAALTAIAMQWPWDRLSKHIPVAKQLQQLNYNNGNSGVFYMSVLRSYIENNWGKPLQFIGGSY
jgi:hypothetical protein